MGQIVPVKEDSLYAAAYVYAESWRASHREICAPAFLAAHTTQRQMDYLRGEMAKGKQIFLLLDPEPVGIVSIWRDCIENLYVLPEQQGRGHGSRLLRFAAAQCRTPRLWILNTNEKARRFYEARGFSLTGQAHVLNEQLKELEMVYSKKLPDKLKIALASARFVNRDTAYSLDQLQRFILLAAQQGADLICFGEAFLQGFDALDWRYETDRNMAVTLDSGVFQGLYALTQETGVDLMLGFLERDGEMIHSSCALLSGGRLLHLYRRISRGWKEYWSTDGHYQEGSEIQPFIYHGRTCLMALCGDLWDAPEQFTLGADLLFWPVYICYTPREWMESIQEEYAAQAAKVCGRVLMINSLCDGDSYGGACYFQDGAISAALPMGQEGLLYVEV